MLSLINTHLLAAGKQSLGWLHPVLYDIIDNDPNVFYDIVKGANPFGACQGFQARPGFDPISGAGTPLFDKLLMAVMKRY